MKLNMDDDNVEQAEITLSQARDDDFDLNDALMDAMDQAQSKVFGGDFDVAYVVIKIVKDPA